MSQLKLLSSSPAGHRAKVKFGLFNLVTPSEELHCTFLPKVVHQSRLAQSAQKPQQQRVRARVTSEKLSRLADFNEPVSHPEGVGWLRWVTPPAIERHAAAAAARLMSRHFGGL